MLTLPRPRLWWAWYARPGHEPECIGSFDALPYRACEVMTKRWPTYVASGWMVMAPDAGRGEPTLPAALEETPKGASGAVWPSRESWSAVGLDAGRATATSPRRDVAPHDAVPLLPAGDVLPEETRQRHIDQSAQGSIWGVHHAALCDAVSGMAHG
jgi:hypothetical protein